MNGKTKLLAVLTAVALLSGQVAYSYWVEKLQTDWTVPVTHAVTLEIALPPEEELLPEVAAVGDMPVQIPEGKAALAGQPADLEQGAAEEAGQSKGEPEVAPSAPATQTDLTPHEEMGPSGDTGSPDVLPDQTAAEGDSAGQDTPAETGPAEADAGSQAAEHSTDPAQSGQNADAGSEDPESPEIKANGSDSEVSAP